MSYDNNDPRLTAYVLDEADADERAAIDEATKTDPALRNLIDEIANVSRAIDRALLANDGLSLTAEQREQIQCRAATRRSRFITRGRIVFGAVVALAACMVIALIFTKERYQPRIAVSKAQAPARIAGGPTSAARQSTPEDNFSRKLIEQPKEANETAGGVNASAAPPAISPPAQISQMGVSQSREMDARLRDLDYVKPAIAEQAAPPNANKLAPAPLQGEPSALGNLDEFSVAPGGSSASAQRGPFTQPTSSEGLQNVQVGRSIVILGDNFSTLAPDAKPAPSGGGGGFGGGNAGGGGFGGGGLGGASPATEQKIDVWSETFQSLGYVGEGTNVNYTRIPGLKQVTLVYEESPNNSTMRWNHYGYSAESYASVVENSFVQVTQQPLSTFGLDVDTASYSNVRRFLNDGQLPPPDAVRVEEFVNAFRYEYTAPSDGRPVAVHGEIAGCPWNAEHRLARIAVKAKDIPFEAQPPLRLTFLIDVSGSMQDNNKLPLLRESMKALTRKLRPTDQIAIVKYNNIAERVLAPTPCSNADEICRTIDCLCADGSTNGAGGIELAYAAAKEQFFEGGLNRVILATDGDFNVGETENAALVQRIQDHAKSGVFLTVLGFGVDNLKDDRLEGLADKGNGNYYYIDSFAEANRVLVDRMAGTIAVAAKDVKIQVEFNPAKIGAYRLLGYENRALAAQDFNDDKKDAGDLGAGHTVTALYELVPVGVPIGAPSVDALKYQAAPAPTTNDNPECMTVKLRYKQPNANESDRIELPVTDAGVQFDSAPTDFRFASATAAFAMLLRNSQFAGSASFEMVQQIAEAAAGGASERTEFVSLVVGAKTLSTNTIGVTLNNIVKWSDGAYRAELTTTVAGKSKRYKEGEVFENYKLLSIDPVNKSVHIYSAKHDKVVELKMQ
jgi:Ca-activated chloride channel family protein